MFTPWYYSLILCEYNLRLAGEYEVERLRPYICPFVYYFLETILEEPIEYLVCSGPRNNICTI